MPFVIKFAGKTYYVEENTADEAVIKLRSHLRDYYIDLSLIECSPIDATTLVVELSCYMRTRHD